MRFKWVLNSIIVITMTLLAVSFLHADPDDKPDRVPEFDEIRESILRHKKSIVEFGIITLYNFPESFPSLSKLPPHIRWIILKSYLELHDNPKLWSLPHIAERSNTPTSKMPLENIQEFWQKKVPLGQRGWINDLNSVESTYKIGQLMQITSNLGIPLTKDIFHELLTLEDLADVLDTQIKRWKEMGFNKPHPAFASERYLRYERKLETLAQLARKVEAVWSANGQSCLRLF